MEGTEHTFPLSDEQANILDEVKHEIEHPAQRRIARHVAANPWGSVIVAALGGLLVGVLIRRQR